jgi:hypothetical protein
MKNSIAKISVSLAVGIITGVILGYNWQKYGWVRSGEANYGQEEYYFNTELAFTGGLVAFAIVIIIFFVPTILKK